VDGRGGIGLTGTKIHLSPNDTCVTSEVHGASVFWTIPVLVNAGHDCEPCGWSLKVTTQSNKRTNVLVYTYVSMNEKLKWSIFYYFSIVF